MRKERLLCMSRIGPRSVRESRTETALVSFPDGRTPFPPLVLLVKTTTLGCVESAVQSSSSPQAQAVTFQLLANRMFVYLHGDPSLNYDPRNLFALRCDLHSCLFDQAQFFFIVPKSPNLIVHFRSYQLRKCSTVPQCYIRSQPCLIS
jgi:hypothetical protein